jgi:chemotaxis response regulator CheB
VVAPETPVAIDVARRWSHDISSEVRQALCEGLESAGGFTVVGPGGDGGEPVGLIDQTNPGIRLLDVGMLDMDGLGGRRHGRGALEGRHRPVHERAGARQS